MHDALDMGTTNGEIFSQHAAPPQSWAFAQAKLSQCASQVLELVQTSINLSPLPVFGSGVGGTAPWVTNFFFLGAVLLVTLDSAQSSPRLTLYSWS